MPDVTQMCLGQSIPHIWGDRELPSWGSGVMTLALGSPVEITWVSLKKY